MGVKTEPSYRYFWSSHEELRDNYISRLMNISRFSWLLAHVHLNDNLILPRKGCDNYDKPHKIRPLIDKLRSSFRRTCKATKEQAVDESVVKFKGRIAFKQYMPTKPINEATRLGSEQTRTVLFVI
ncbi:piggyBac transposable element-derived protein 4-like [Artemia franciscana]|uniref:piggyBac transposable element-derived protein 4-like n=1 Tax=Artemia franciscana TaxID=6661 RepID=UPI0032DB5D85